MKQITKAVVCTFISIFAFWLVQQILETNEAPVFETGTYTDYYYSCLTETEKQAYTAVREQIYSFPENIRVPELDSAALENVLEALICDNPCMFMFDSCSLITAGSATYFEPQYTMTATEYEAQNSAANKKADSIIAAMPDTNEYEKQLFLHDSVVSMCIYSDTDSASEDDIYGVFSIGRAKCSGYAKAYKLLLDKAGIPCALVSGYAEDYDGNGAQHMWVATQTEGIWSYTDITWDDPITENGESICRHVYFCMSENMLSRTHSDYGFDFECPDSGLYYYKAKNIYYNDYNNEILGAVSRNIAAAESADSSEVELMFADLFLLNQAEKSLFTNEDIYTVLNEAAAINPSIITDRIRYHIDYDINLITLYFETED